MARATEVVHFLRSDPGELVAVLADLAVRRDGWVNLQAVIDDGEGGDGGQTPGQVPGGPPARAGLFGLVAGRGPTVPVCTWVPGARTARGDEPDSLGIQHGAGPKAMRRLLEAGAPPPDGAVLRGDHPRRGLVVELAPGTDPATLLRWMLTASDVLAPGPLPDTWVAVVHRR